MDQLIELRAVVHGDVAGGLDEEFAVLPLAFQPVGQLGLVDEAVNIAAVVVDNLPVDLEVRVGVAGPGEDGVLLVGRGLS